MVRAAIKIRVEMAGWWTVLGGVSSIALEYRWVGVCR
jgi:hypothetical protein